MVAGPRRMQRRAKLLQSFARIIGNRQHLIGNWRRMWRQAETREQIETRAEPMKANHVLRSALVPRRIIPNIELNPRVIVSLNNAVPANHQWPQQPQMLLPHKEQSRTFRPQHPLMPICRQKIDSIGLHIERKDAETLNRVQKEQATDTATELANLPNINPPTRGIADPANAEDSRLLVARIN